MREARAGVERGGLRQPLYWFNVDVVVEGEVNTSGKGQTRKRVKYRLSWLVGTGESSSNQ